MFRLKRLLLRPLRTALENRDLQQSQPDRWSNILIHVNVDYQAPHISRDELVTKVRSALSLIRRYDQRRFRRLQSDAPRILVQASESSHYRSLTNTILIALSMVHQYDPATIAGEVIHEATHARIHKHGVVVWPALMRRIERRCLLEQIDFLERVGSRPDLVAYYVSWLDRSWWSAEDVARRRLAFFAARGLPRWLIALYSWRYGLTTADDAKSTQPDDLP